MYECKYWLANLFGQCARSTAAFLFIVDERIVRSLISIDFSRIEFVIVQCCVRHESVWLVPTNANTNALFKNRSIEQSKSIIRDNHALHWLFGVGMHHPSMFVRSFARSPLLILTFLSTLKQISFIRCTSTLNSLYKHVKQFFSTQLYYLQECMGLKFDLT